MTVISASISQTDKEFLDLLVKLGKYTSRSATLTEAIRLLKEQECAGKRHTTPIPRYKPILSRITIQADSYYFPEAMTKNQSPEELRTAMMNELKKKQIAMGLRSAESIQEIDAGFDLLEFDPTKCKEPILKKCQIIQCPNFRVDGEDYCYDHLK